MALGLSPSCQKVKADDATNDTESTIDDAMDTKESIVSDDKFDRRP